MPYTHAISAALIYLNRLHLAETIMKILESCILDPRMVTKHQELPLDFNPFNTREIDYENDLGAPGEFPYTRGIYPNMYRGRLWTMRQYAGYATAEESNARYKYLLAHGTTGLSVAFDLPTQIGLDSDDPLAQGEVGKVGVAIDSLEDMERLFAGIPLDEVSTSMTINATAAILLSLYLAVARKQNVPFSKVRGTLQNDILKEYIARGTYIYPPAPSLRLVTDIFAFCAREVPNWNTISISGYHIREAGSTAVQEVAFTLADGIAYVEAALEAGLEIDDFAPRIRFSSTRIIICLKRSLSFVRRDDYGRASCAIDSTREIQNR